MNTTSMHISFITNPAIKGREDKFVTLKIAVEPVVKSWKHSLFAHEWVKPDGTLKSPHELSDANRAKRLRVEERLKKGEALECPVLGLGVTDEVEIGSGRDVLLTLADHEVAVIEVHVPKSHSDDFRAFVLR
jgi:hypothetical protein